jgi:hypothetical protein
MRVDTGRFAWPTTTWSWNGVAWVRAGGRRPVRTGGRRHGLRQQRQEIVLFGGQGAAAADGQLQALYGDTWVWNGRTWRNASNIGPSARAFHTMSFDRRACFVLMHGGEQRGVILDDLWAWDGPAGGSCRSPALRRESAGCTLWLTMRVGRGPSSTVAYAATPTATPVPTTTRGNGTGGGGTASGDLTPIE